MIFNLKRDNYYNFKVYKDNVLKPRSYFIPFGYEEEMAQNDFRTERYNSSRVDVLNGEWDFKYFAKVSDMPSEIDVDEYVFDKVPVPSMWQFTGYEEPYYLNTRYQFNPNPPEIPKDCPVGVYHRVFNIDDASMNYTLAFLGVAGGLEVYINGKYVGYSEGSHNTSEFEINEFVDKGENHLVVVNHKWTNGTYLEAQDMFRNNGIFRDVLLYKTKNNSIYDFEIVSDCVVAGREGQYAVSIKPSLKLSDKCVLSAMLYDDGELVASFSANQSPKMLQAINLGTLDLHSWSAECPYLYDLVLVLSKEDEIVELVHKNIGFKHIDILGNVFRFNGQGIKLFGVNHHDSNSKTGYVMTVEDMERDVQIFKEYNVNCVRTSHYPPDPIFLDLCDEYGIYIVDEADIETHGCQTELHRAGACSHNPEWQDRYWDRVYRMFERDKNHPSITMWSLGNESWGYKNQDYCYAELKKRSSIPVHYENVIKTKRFAYDVISEMYPWHNKYAQLASGKGLSSKWYRKPYFLCEYAHAMGLGAGELETYVSKFIEADNLMGGCIWEFVDHAVYHENGKYKYTYGGDHGEEKHDGNFCVDGLFFPDRTPHSGALQMKNCYRPVRARMGDNQIIFRCLNYFEPEILTAQITALDEKGNTVSVDNINLAIEPQTEIAVDYDLNKYAVVIRYFRDDFEIGAEQFEIGTSVSTGEPIEFDNAPALRISENSKLFIELDNGQVIFNTKTGELESYVVGGKEFINTAPFGSLAGIGVSLFRAPIDNDRNIKSVWDKYKLDSERMYLKSCKYSLNSNSYQINNTYVIKTNVVKKLAIVDINYNIYRSGAMSIVVSCKRSKPIPFLPRFGAVMEMPREFENVRYFGYGDRPNCDDYKEHAMLGVYQMKVDEMREKYIKPQESSMRAGVRWFEVTNNDGVGLRFTPSVEESLTFGADHFTSHQCAKTQHQEDLKLCDTTVVHIDEYMLGAASGACGPVPSKQYRANSAKGMWFSFDIEPIGE